MTKKMKLPSIFKNKAVDQLHMMNAAWQWPSCGHATKTLSFRADAGAGAGAVMFKTVNSVYLDPSSVDDGGVETPDSWFTNTSESASFSTESDDERIIVTGVRSDRLFFDRAENNTSSSIAAAAAATAAAATPPENQENLGEEAPFAASVVMTMESADPYADFKKSMEEMVESQGMRDWESLQELLGWYLKMNAKVNHGFILGAFVDLLIHLTSSSSSSSSSPKTCHHYPSNHVSTSYSSALSTLSSPPTSPLSSLDLKEIHEQG
ncbi:PREDICTED: transcription repressor OFP13-like [Ipomoea nil]|uniref:transcription repressor OFP13-like n=1 Tax=Ipomoea nil TaxID=35883 RepID=UPI000901E64E|nr:PREDICTED: transcription repressor OFP13-like [Ipomoea nil]